MGVRRVRAARVGAAAVDVSDERDFRGGAPLSGLEACNEVLRRVRGGASLRLVPPVVVAPSAHLMRVSKGAGVSQVLRELADAHRLAAEIVDVLAAGERVGRDRWSAAVVAWERVVADVERDLRALDWKDDRRVYVQLQAAQGALQMVRHHCAALVRELDPEALA